MVKSAKGEVVFDDKPTHLRKARAKRLPIGSTKSEMLLFVANNGDVDTLSLKWHLKKQFGIKNKKNLLIHLAGLTEEGLLKKKSNGKGNADTYYLEKNFSNLKSVFNYLKENRREKEFLATRFFKEYINSDDFQIKFVAHLIRSMTLAMINYLETEDTSKMVSDDAKRESDKLLVQIANFVKSSEPVSPNLATLDNFSKVSQGADISNKKKFQKMVNVGIALLRKTDVDTFAEFIMELDLFGDFIKKLPQLDLIGKEKPQIIAMLKFSPTAVDYIINLDKLNPMGIVSAWMRFMAWTINDDPEKAKTIQEILSDTSDRPDRLSQVYELMKDFSKVLNKSPIYNVINSGVIFDYMNRNFVIPETREEEIFVLDIVNETLLPKIANKDIK